MPRLKDYISSDLNVFFDLDEFAEEHNIDGKTMAVIIDNDMLQRRKMSQADGTYTGELLFYVRKNELGSKPAIGQHITFDDMPYRVSDCQDDGNLYIITLEAYLS
jgi:hypothetical protein